MHVYVHTYIRTHVHLSHQADCVQVGQERVVVARRQLPRERQRRQDSARVEG
jgi:hypothetical protein